VRCDGVALCDERGCIACARKREQDRQTRTNQPIALAPFCAICIDGTTKLRAVQLDEGGPVYTLCKSCDEDDAKTLASDAPRRSPPPRQCGRGGGWQRTCYEPIDETRRRIVFRILAAIRHFDWVSSFRLSEVLQIPSWNQDPAARNAFDGALSRLTRGGFLRRAKFDAEWSEYQITELGLARYENEIRRSIEARRSIAA